MLLQGGQPETTLAGDNDRGQRCGLKGSSEPQRCHLHPSQTHSVPLFPLPPLIPPYFHSPHCNRRIPNPFLLSWFMCFPSPHLLTYTGFPPVSGWLLFTQPCTDRPKSASFYTSDFRLLDCQHLYSTEHILNTWACTHMHTYSILQHYEKGAIIISILWMREARKLNREVKLRMQNYQLGQDLNPRGLAPQSMLWTTPPYHSAGAGDAR